MYKHLVIGLIAAVLGNITGMFILLRNTDNRLSFNNFIEISITEKDKNFLLGAILPSLSMALMVFLMNKTIVDIWAPILIIYVILFFYLLIKAFRGWRKIFWWMLFSPAIFFVLAFLTIIFYGEFSGAYKQSVSNQIKPPAIDNFLPKN